MSYVIVFIGWIEIDFNILIGFGYLVCWWDWWGYYCDYYMFSKEEGGFNYKVGVGLCWDISCNFVV